jgi:hypothetical protein
MWRGCYRLNISVSAPFVWRRLNRSAGNIALPTNANERAAWKVIVKHAPRKTEAQAKDIIKAWRNTGLLTSKDYENPATRKPVKVGNSKRPS